MAPRQLISSACIYIHTYMWLQLSRAALARAEPGGLCRRLHGRSHMHLWPHVHAQLAPGAARGESALYVSLLRSDRCLVGCRGRRRRRRRMSLMPARAAQPLRGWLQPTEAAAHSGARLTAPLHDPLRSTINGALACVLAVCVCSFTECCGPAACAWWRCGLGARRWRPPRSCPPSRSSWRRVRAHMPSSLLKHGLHMPLMLSSVVRYRLVHK
jgi:hypothetical protein